MNEIPNKQNQEHFLSLLAAQRQLYDEEKKWRGCWSILAVVVAMFGTGAIALTGSFSHFVGLLSTVVMIAEFTIFNFIRVKGREAAKIQELFDTKLLDLEWNTTLIPCKPKKEFVEAAKERFRNRRKPDEWEKLKNWYRPEVGLLPIHQARIACQHENIWWDSDLRRQYANYAFTFAAVIFVLLVIVGFLVDWTLVQFFQGPIPLFMPVIYLPLQHGFANRSAASRLDELHQIVTELAEKAAKTDADSKELQKQSRELQNEIYHNRADNPPVVSWFYQCLQEHFEKRAKSTIGT